MANPALVPHVVVGKDSHSSDVRRMPDAYKAKQIAVGDQKNLSTRRKIIFEQFQQWNIEPKQILQFPQKILLMNLHKRIWRNSSL